ncbi:hypothetical protein E1B28_007425 [Marasmius oreades]|uniref:Geranylgeranyl transferase type-2 subunit alpha n=1 Tax=Marasmius oreades TaxID=181124 RepID=A0A9P7S3C6_9AGAR|nr:uncharacterized protein E1B28_007425 [Marasmius oreades]KAG7093778.1 hypothetical protein E1B28_007425 [Marasmius oreades]
MITDALKRLPTGKVYWIWNHRRWCLEDTPQDPGTLDEGEHMGWEKVNWNKELDVVGRMLEADPRNFLAWIIEDMFSPTCPILTTLISELAYTTKKIEFSLTNFSAWHQRSKVLPSLWADGVLDPAILREEEFDLVKNALFTEPNDQSAWIYHRWLVGSRIGSHPVPTSPQPDRQYQGPDRRLLEREVSVLQELLDEQPYSKCWFPLSHSCSSDWPGFREQRVWTRLSITSAC